MEHILQKDITEQEKTDEMMKVAIDAGFRWGDALEALTKVREELDELEVAIRSGVASDISDEFGDVIMSSATLGHHLNLSREFVLAHSNQKFAFRYACMERYVESQNKTMENAAFSLKVAGWKYAKEIEKQKKKS